MEVEESPDLKGFQCCSMCMRHCFETHGDFGRSEAEKLFSAPSFFSLIEASHVTGHKFLKIPAPFMEKQNYNIGDKLSLKGPSGFECEATLQQHDNGFALQTAFDQFLEHHKVEAGDLLIFNLIANSSFLIKVYDKCGSEKPFLRKPDPKCRPSSKESLHEEDIEDGDDDRGREGIDKNSVDCVHVSPVSKDLDVGDVGDMNQLVANREQPAASKDLHTVAQVSDRRCEENLGNAQSRSGQKRKQPAMPVTLLREENGNEPDEFGVSVSKQEAVNRQFNAANALIQELRNPSQLVIMSKSHVNMHQKNPHIELRKLPLPKVTEVLTLIDSAEEQYTVKLWVPSKDGQKCRFRLTCGWSQFVMDHNLRTGDVCVFEATDIYLIVVHIFRLADYYKPNTETQPLE